MVSLLCCCQRSERTIVERRAEERRKAKEGAACHKIVSCRTMKSYRRGNPLSRKVGFCLSVDYHWQINFPFKGSSSSMAN